MDTDFHPLHMFFFPLMAPGHMLPMIDMARCFAERGVMVGIITTPLNASRFQKAIDRTAMAGHQIKLHIIKFPCSEAGLPDGCEHSDQITSADIGAKFFVAVNMLQEPVDRLVEEHHPNCIVSDFFLPWTVDIASKHSIPRLVFHGISCLANCAGVSIARHAPHQTVSSDTQVFILPGLPHRIEMTKSQLPKFMKVKGQYSKPWENAEEAERRSYGIVANSFYELEKDYIEFYKREVGKKVWAIGPVSLCNHDVVEKTHRGNKAAMDEDECMKWLDSMEPSSVVYICFGSMHRHANSQLLEIASALEASGHPFIWVAGNHPSLSNEPWLPNGFEERMEGKGLIIRGWAPQLLILDHPSVGAFMTHCGWNSVLEGVTAAVPMITWPAFAEQFFNEKLITHVMKIGVGVGVVDWVDWLEETRPLVKREEIERAIRKVMDGGDEANEIKMRARLVGEMAKKAVEEGGSSYVEMTNLIEELEKIRGRLTLNHDGE